MELLDIVDVNDVVIGTATREEMYAKKLTHRIVHVLIFDSEGNWGLQQRSASASFCPLHWGPAAGGHVHSGETPLSAAKREMHEELGVEAPIEQLFHELYIVPTLGLAKWITFFKAQHNGPFKLRTEEVADFKFFAPNEIRRMMQMENTLHPELTFLINKHFPRI